MVFDATQIGDALDLASQGTSTLGGALDLVGKAKRLFQKDGGQGETEELKQLVGELSQELTQARMTNLEVVLRLQEIQAHATRSADFSTKRAKYAPHRTELGGNVLRLIEPDDAGLWATVCPVCAETKQELIPLQDEEGIEYICPQCKTGFLNKRSSSTGRLKTGWDPSNPYR